LNGEKECFCIYPTLKRQNFKMKDAISLGQLLRQNAGSHFSRADRYSIALVLASSHIDLQSSPWLDKNWTKDDIIFLKRDTNILLQEPYLVRDVPHNSSQASPPTPEDCSFVSLGIALLELCFGTPIESHPSWHKYGLGTMAIPDPFLLHALALEWRLRVGEEAGPEYAEAVDWCLEFKRTSGGSWRRELDEKVIGGLECCQIKRPADP
jgi:hypothetical protein